jgi:Fur family ferric uptake transcriptional regulator
MNWENELAAQGFRITAARRAVMGVLLAAPAPLSPQEICQQGREACRRLGLVTVYRTLALLEDHGWVRRVHREDHCHAYVSCSPGHSHAMVCRECGRTTEFPGAEDLRTLIARVEATTGYRVDDHLLQLSGLCPECQA